MSVVQISQDPYVAGTVSEMNGLLSSFPNLPEYTLCGVLSPKSTYQLQSGSWVQWTPDTNLEARMSSCDTTLSSLTTRMGSLEAWRAAKVSSPDVSTSVSVPTAIITLGLNCPTVAGINALGSTIMSEINAIKAALRTREIFS